MPRRRKRRERTATMRGKRKCLRRFVSAKNPL